MSDADETRVLNMRINNKEFLKGTADSVKALDTLNKGIDSAAKGKGMQNMSKSVETVKTKFGALQIAGVTAMANLSNRAVNAGISILKGLTIDPILDGWHEYEKILNSTQTIMANTGKSVNVVNKYLNNLNHYSDQTIYNFGQMADNIGKFTAAGVKIDVATSAIKGLANSAALFGSDSQQLNTAMYQMSQALATGTIKLMDWNSLANAGMGGKNMRDSLMATAKTLGDHGAAMDKAMKKNGNFRDSLRDGWLNADVFTKTMKVMAGTTNSTGKTVAYTVDQLKKMGYATSAAKNLHRLSQAAIDSATKIKTFSQLLDVVKEAIGSGWSQIFRRLFGNFSQASKMWTSVGNQITGTISLIFNEVDKMLAQWQKLGGYKELWAGLGNIFKSIGNLLMPVLHLFGAILPSSKGAGSGMYSLTHGFYLFSVALENVTSGTRFLIPLIDVLGSVINFVFSLVGKWVSSMADLFQILSPIASALGRLAEALGGLADRLLSMIGISDGLSGMFDSFISIRRDILTPFVDIIVTMIDALTALVNGDINFEQFKKTIASAFSGIGTNIGDIAARGKQIASDLIAGLSEGLSSGAIQNAIGNWVNGFVNFFRGLLGIHSPSTVFAEFGKNIVEGLVNGLLGAISLIGKAINAIGSSLMNMDKFDIANMLTVLFGGAAVVVGLRFVKSISGIFKQSHQIFGNINQLLNQTTNTLKTMQNSVRAKMILNIGIAVALLAGSLKLLSTIPGEKLAVGLGAVGTLLAGLVVTMKAMAAGAATTKTAIASMTAMSFAMTLMAGAVLILSAAVLAFGNMKTGVLVKGLAAVTATLLILSGAALVLGKAAPSMILSAAGVLILSVALGALAPVILLFSKLDWSTLISGLAKMGVALVTLGIAMIPLSAMAPMLLIASASLIVLSAGLTAMLATIGLFSTVSWGTIISGVAKIAAALIVLGAASLIASPGLIALGVAAVLIGAGLLSAGIGMALFAAGLAAVAAAGTAAAAVLVSAFEGFLSLLPLMAVQLVAALAAFIKAFADKSPEIVDSLVKIGTQLLRGFNELQPKIVESLVKLIESLLKGLRRVIPEIADASREVVLAILQGIADDLPKLIQAGTDIIVGFITGIGNAASQLVDAAGQTILSFLTAINDAIVTYEPQIIAAGLLIGKSLILGLVTGLVPQPILNAFTSLVDTVVNFFKNLLGIHSPSTVFAGFGRNIVEGLANGIQAAIGLVITIIGNLVDGAVGIVRGLPGKARSALSGLGGILKSVFGGAFKIATSTVSSGVGNIGSAIGRIPGILRSAIGAAGNAAKSLGQAIVEGIKKGLGKAVGAVGNLGSSLIRALKDAINSALNLPFNIPKLTLKIGPKHFSVGGQQLIPKFAKGVTGFGGGAALVGEVGPELVTMGRGANVITNEKLTAFMKVVTSLVKAMAGSSVKNSPGGNIQFAVSADFRGDPKARGVEFAANLAAGLVNGLRGNQAAVNSTMADVGNSMSNTFAQVLGIQSPSTVFKKYAGFVGQGFINGLLASVAGVQKAAALMGNAAISAIAKTITEGQLKLEALRGKADAFADAAAELRAKARRTKSKKERKRLEAEAKALEKRSAAEQKIAEAQARAVDAKNAADERKAEFDAADTQGKADMRKEDAATAAGKASRAREAAIRLAKEADLVRKFDKKRAAELDKLAQAQLAKSKKYADQASAYAKESYELAEKAKQEAGAETAASIAAQLQSVTDADVAKAQAAFESYSKLLANAESSASSDLPPTEIKFEQNNYSPEAISAGDAYRNGKTLVSIAEQKLAPTG